jgi:uncharacterized repeat protein (TIGR01451 family)
MSRTTTTLLCLIVFSFGLIQLNLFAQESDSSRRPRDETQGNSVLEPPSKLVRLTLADISQDTATFQHTTVVQNTAGEPAATQPVQDPVQTAGPRRLQVPFDAKPVESMMDSAAPQAEPSNAVTNAPTRGIRPFQPAWQLESEVPVVNAIPMGIPFVKDDVSPNLGSVLQKENVAIEESTAPAEPAVPADEDYSSFPILTGKPPVDASAADAVIEDIVRESAPAVDVPADISAEIRSKAESEIPSIRAANNSSTSMVPILSLEAVGPQEFIVGQVANYEMILRNLGETTATEVTLTLRLPKDIQLINQGAHHIAESNGDIRVDVGTIVPNDQQQIHFEFKSEHTGDFQIGTKVAFATSNEIPVRVTQPKLAIETSGPASINYGEQSLYKVRIKNKGDGTAERVVLHVDLPQGFTSDAGKQLDVEIGDLAQGETREITLPLIAKSVGNARIQWNVKSATGRTAATATEVTVLRPALAAEVQGPDVVYLDHEAIYAITIKNPSELPVTAVRLKLLIPEGLDVTSIDQEAQFDNVQRSLTWSFPKVNAGESHTVQLKATAVLAGRQLQSVTVSCAENVGGEITHDTMVISRSDVSVEISDNSVPIKVGESSSFTITLKNKGSKQADKVVCEIDLPEGLSAIQSPNYTVDGSKLRFAPFDMKAEQIVHLQFDAVGITSGDHVVRVSMRHADSSRELITEENVFYYEPVQKRVASQNR